MFSTIYLDERVAILPSELNNIRSEDGIKDIILTKLKEKHEGKCNANGYVKPNSIELIARCSQNMTDAASDYAVRVCDG